MDKPSGHHARSSSDPLLDVLRAQHANESQDERNVRLRREAEAKKISDAIDEQLKAEEKARAKKRTEIKILLLGEFPFHSFRWPFTAYHSPMYLPTHTHLQ